LFLAILNRISKYLQAIKFVQKNTKQTCLHSLLHGIAVVIKENNLNNDKILK